MIIHWLGEMFDPALDGYWGHKDHMKAMEVAVDVIASNPAKVDGVKICCSTRTRNRHATRLPQGVRMFTGDDFNYAELIAGDAQGYSDALLGIFDAIAPAASAALARSPAATSRRSTKSWRRRCRCRATSSSADPLLQDRRGVRGLSHGLQNHFTMIAGQESTRSTLHLAELFRLADAAGCWPIRSLRRSA